MVHQFLRIDPTHFLQATKSTPVRGGKLWPMSLKSVEPQSHLPILSEVVNSLTVLLEGRLLSGNRLHASRDQIGQVSAHSFGPEEQNLEGCITGRNKGASPCREEHWRRNRWKTSRAWKCEVEDFWWDG